MCGISGVITKNKLTGELKNAVSRMSRAQIHRGPDGAGEFSGDQVALASRRLSIIDPNGGWQPLYNEDESLVLVANGEIYNYIELRELLKFKGHKFKTDSDCEIILHLYEEDQTNFIRHLRGMFAFALWDEKRRKLILARDRMGEKPLYIYQDEEKLLFASEMKALLQSGFAPFKLDARAVNLYFHYQYVPEPLTAIENVRKLDAAKMLVVDAAKWEFEEKTYWRMEDAPPLEGEPKVLIRQKLEEVSELIVRSDVPIGTALSGGLDSSIVAAFAAKKQPSLCAFSVGYTGRPEPDERADAEALANYLKIPFFNVELDTNSIVDFFPELNFLRDDPIADISGFGYYAVMKLARENKVPVMLQGQGGDELFWGYPQLRAAFEINAKKALSRQKSFFQQIFGCFELSRRDILQNLKYPNRMIFYEVSADFKAAFAMRKFYTKKFRKKLSEDAAFDLFTEPDEWNDIETALTSMACKTYLRENGIAQGDRLGMASSVEMRLPLVDYQFVETVVGLRKNSSDALLPPKFRLREAVEDILPKWVLDRPKRGFAPPTREWHDALFRACGDSLREGYLVQSDVLTDDAGSRFARGEFPANATSPLSFKALVLEQWCRRMSELS